MKVSEIYNNEKQLQGGDNPDVLHISSLFSLKSAKQGKPVNNKDMNNSKLLLFLFKNNSFIEM